MDRTRFVVDIRKHRGDSRFVVELVRCFCSRSRGATIDWLVRPDQTDLIPPESIIGTAEPSDRTWGTRLRDHLVQISQKDQNATGGAFYLLSYDNWVLNLARVASPSSATVTALHISELFKMGIHKELAMQALARGETAANPRFARRLYPVFDAVQNKSRFLSGPSLDHNSFTLEDAIRLTKQALRNGCHVSPATGLPQKELRPRLSALDFRARRQRGNPTSELLIPNIVDKGLQEGWLKRFRGASGKTGTEIVYLVEDGISVPAAESSERVVTLAAPATHQANPPIEASTPNQGPPSIAADSVLPSVTPAANSPQSAEGAEPKHRKHPNRATEFEAILSKSRIGAMPETRDRLFEALEAEFAESKNLPLPLLELFAKAVCTAREKADVDGYTAEKNWNIAQMCVKRLMQWSSVLLGEDGQPVSDGIGSNAKKVSSLEPNFRCLCEAYLIEHIIEKSGGVNFDDEIYYLGLTVYRRGKERAVAAEELKAKADATLSYLDQQGRILLDADRMLRIKPPRTRSLAVAR
jgi:hypothetical protein